MHAARRATRFEGVDVQIRTWRYGYGLAHEAFENK
jgi:hypothetical protein